MIYSQNLTKIYGDQTVLNIESLDIPKGQSFGLVGNNGAGKTTFFSLLLDLIQPTTGKVMNNDIIRIDTSVSAALGLAPDLQRLARAENFVEDGTIDARRD